jgi:hypothetical protein
VRRAVRTSGALIEQNMRVTTVVLSYRRAILIAVYTHLLCELRFCTPTLVPTLRVAVRPYTHSRLPLSHAANSASPIDIPTTHTPGP